MPTIIAKRIKATVKNQAENARRAKILVNYITTPIDKDGLDKCAEVRAMGFPASGYSLEEMTEMIQDDLEMPQLQNSELLTHWIISWKGDDLPSNDEAFEAAREHMTAIGYTPDHKQIYAIHENTGNLHVHIAACKVQQWSGKILREGWYKNASQKALVGIAEKYGWSLEPGHHFTRPKKNDKAKVSQKARAKEAHTGKESEQRKLARLLEQFLEEHEDEFEHWKFGHFHKALAEIGIECQRVEPRPGAYGIVFSLDSKTWCKASSVCPALTYTKLLQKLNAKSWRDARPEIKTILETARTGLPARPITAAYHIATIYYKHSTFYAPASKFAYANRNKLDENDYRLLILFHRNKKLASTLTVNLFKDEQSAIKNAALAQMMPAYSDDIRRYALMQERSKRIQRQRIISRNYRRDKDWWKTHQPEKIAGTTSKGKTVSESANSIYGISSNGKIINRQNQMVGISSNGEIIINSNEMTGISTTGETITNPARMIRFSTNGEKIITEPAMKGESSGQPANTQPDTGKLERQKKRGHPRLR